MKAGLLVLRSVKSLPYGVGKKLLGDLLKGELSPQILRNKLDANLSFGILRMKAGHEITTLIDNLFYYGYLKRESIPGKVHIKVIAITKKGEAAIRDKKIILKDTEFKYDDVTEKDLSLFKQLGDIFGNMTPEQKKCTTDPSKRILCIAGAGTGKTKVLTERIKFLIKYRGVNPKKILAITFTRKARDEMLERVSTPGVTIETFNSFCEKILREKGKKIFSNGRTILDFSGQIKLVNRIIESLNLTPNGIVQSYFGERRCRFEDNHILYLRLIGDIFSALDHQRNFSIEKEEFLENVRKCDASGPIITKIIEKILIAKEKQGLRDFTDQLTDCIRLFKSFPDTIPDYDHVMIDEYQDVNNLQIQISDLLTPKNLFAVGDPRQSIFGWRGSEIRHILEFKKTYPDAIILPLKRNFRSAEKIVEICNSVIQPMHLPELHAEKKGDERAVIRIEHASDDAERIFVCQSILSQECKKKDIFILARTNNELVKMSGMLGDQGISYIKRTTEGITGRPGPDSVTLSTVHAIKGLEASVVYLIGADFLHFPIRAKEHPLIEAVKQDYDKKSEELRLLYVALSRAKDTLVINHSKTISPFFRERSKYHLNIKQKKSLFQHLREWRTETAGLLRIKPYQVLTDRTLMQLCEEKPLTRSELPEIYGLGPGKIRKFGEDILELIRNHE